MSDWFLCLRAGVKLRRGSGVEASGCIEGEIPRGQKPRRAPAFDRQLTLLPKVTNPHREEGLEGHEPVRGALTPVTLRRDQGQEGIGSERV
jgi:hypothetical protein